MKSQRSLAEYLKEHAIEAEFVLLPGDTRTVVQAAAALETAPERIVKSLLFLAGEDPVLVIASGPGRIETARLAAYFGIPESDIRLAGNADVLRITGYEIGSVPPVGHDPGLCTLIDPAVLEFDEVYAGGGAHNRLLRLSPRAILMENHAHVIELQSSR
jgi:prolyl-tRNA editing enzyme YbaK/EbsC (Cys-tRNA(Pro) deacylase)